MIRKIAAMCALSAAMVWAAGCTLPGEEQQSQATTPSLANAKPVLDDLASVVYVAAQVLGERSEGLIKGRPIVVTTIVSIDDLKTSSTFGRLVSELVANRFAQRGYLIRDVRYTRALEINETGELVLSRTAMEVLKPINAQAVLAGTYAVAGQKIYVNLRLINADNGELLSSADVVVNLDSNTRPLVAAEIANRREGS